MDPQAEAYVRLYERQMSHYEKTQEIEWKGSFGIWTLLAAAIALALQHPAAIPHEAWRVVLMGVVTVHVFWLLFIHRSEEADKALWSRYRDRAEELLGRATPQAGSEWWRGLDWVARRVIWIAMEAVVTAGMALLLWSIVSRS